MHPRFLRRRRFLHVLVWTASGVTAGLLSACSFFAKSDGRPAAASAPAAAAGLQAFADVVSVLRHPRCINCHPAGDVPHQTDGQRLHFPPVERGTDNRGVTAMRCRACHQTENQLNGVPGAPHWSLAPRMMAWEGLNDGELAAQLKDRRRNGGRTLDQLIEHVEHDHLILWAWQPGGERTPPALSHPEFVRRLKDWVAAGAPLPSRSQP